MKAAHAGHINGEKNSQRAPPFFVDSGCWSGSGGLVVVAVAATATAIVLMVPVPMVPIFGEIHASS